ncbi:hypothetical protein P4H82_27880 [Bacillus cereus]|nr:hypothetical protein [Bacillus cereus]MEB9190660.1 hypothetical protein [Bacillus cereus]
MLRTSNLLSLFFLSLWTFFCLGAFYQTEFGALSSSSDYENLGRYLGILGLAQLVVTVVNLVDLWKEKY